MATEITRATQAGIDGFTTDPLSIDAASRQWRLVKALLAAAPTADPAFKIVLMPDMNAGTIKQTDAAGLAAVLSQLITGAAYRLADGRLLVAPFKAENRSPDWWADFNAAMKANHGENVALVPMVLNVNDVIHGGKNNIDACAPVSYGIAETENGAPKNQDSIPGKSPRPTPPASSTWPPSPPGIRAPTRATNTRRAIPRTCARMGEVHCRRFRLGAADDVERLFGAHPRLAHQFIMDGCGWMCPPTV